MKFCAVAPLPCQQDCAKKGEQNVTESYLGSLANFGHNGIVVSVFRCFSHYTKTGGLSISDNFRFYNEIGV